MNECEKCGETWSVIVIGDKSKCPCCGAEVTHKESSRD